MAFNGILHFLQLSVIFFSNKTNQGGC